MKTNDALLEQVREALEKDENLKNFLKTIYILVHDGSVILAGSVGSTLLKNRAKQIVSNIPGVSRLIEDLKVDPIIYNRVGVQIDWATGSMILSS